MPSGCALLGGFAIGARVSLLRQHSPNAKCQRALLLALCLVLCVAVAGVLRKKIPLVLLDVLARVKAIRAPVRLSRDALRVGVPWLISAVN